MFGDYTFKITLQGANELTYESWDIMAIILQMPFFQFILLNRNFCALIQLSLKYVPYGKIANTD